MSAEQLHIGRLIETPQQRDAIHVPVCPVTAVEWLDPGQRVEFVQGCTDKVRRTSGNGVGVIDPFLTDTVFENQRCWLFLHPGTITSLRHEWTHPAFDSAARPTPTKDESEAWLRQFVKNADCPDFDTVIAAATGKYLPVIDTFYSSAYGNDGDYLHFNGRDAHGEIPPEFWDHVQNFTGIEIPYSQRAPYFSCSC